MSAAPNAARAARLLERLSSEQRSRQRYPIELDVEYKLLGKSGHRGSGRTRNISSNGVLFVVAEPLAVGRSVELMMNWPCLLEGACHLKLVMKGRIVRGDGKGVAIASRKHEFRTAGPVTAAKRRHSTSQTTTP
jgi:hypothetical protein